MATPFIASAKIVQSADGKKVTLADMSNWIDNTEGYVITNFNRYFELRDADDQLIATVNITGTNLTVDYEITKDQYLKIRLVIDGTGNLDFEYSFNVGLDRFTNNAYDCMLAKSCNCGSGLSIRKDRLIDAALLMKGATNGLKFGNGNQFDKYITDAYTLLTEF